MSSCDNSNAVYPSDDEDEVRDYRQRAGVKVVDGLDLRQLIEDRCTTFTVEEDESGYNDSYKYELPNDDALKHLGFSALDIDTEEEYSSTEPFDLLASKMKDVTSCGKVKKRELRPGIGSVIPKGAYAIIHYNAYTEYQDEPFDSSYMRGRPHCFWLKPDDIISGMYESICSMKKREKSLFLVHPDLGYGKMGCPPRIPGESYILYQIEVLNFNVSALSDMSIEADYGANFAAVFKTAERESSTGGDLFRKNNLKGAIEKYKRALNMLTCYKAADMGEERRINNLLLKLYTNLAICFNLEKKPKQACTFTSKALYIQANHPKALFARGRALRMLKDFKEAEYCLKKALKLKPDNTEIAAELLKLSNEKKQSEEGEKISCQRMFLS